MTKGEGGEVEQEGGNTNSIHVIKVEKINKEKHSYPRAAVLCLLFKETALRALVLTLPRDSALHNPEKAKRGMISVKAK